MSATSATLIPTLTNTAHAVETTCAYCGVGCGVRLEQDEQGQWIASGDQTHPANHGKLCVKGSALAETIGMQDRLLHPQVNGIQVDWDTALSTVADRFNDIINKHGPDAVAFYVSGQLLTEDYYVANKLMKGFIGSANIDTNSRLCMSTAVAAHKQVLGADAVPGCYDDFDVADLLVITGSNMAWTHPIVFQRIVSAKKANPDLKIVVIDPRKTATCDIADLHLAIAPGSDGFLFDGLFAWLAQQDLLDQDYLAAYTDGADAAITASVDRFTDIASLAQQCGLDNAELETFFDWFGHTDKTVTIFSQGINQSSSGVDKASAILNCHVATGRIGKPGACPFSITGQPNAMGGREVGGLANQLAAHMDITNAEHRDLVQRFWQSPVIASEGGLKAVDLFDAIADGKVKAVWVMATNPVVSLPNADKVKAALEQCEFVVVSDCVANTDTLDLAHVKLPAAGWGEKDGTVTNSERRISRQRAFLPLPGDAKPDWWIISQTAMRMGHEQAFNYHSPAAIFAEHARLSAFENNGQRDFDISALSALTDAEYNALVPVQWPVSSNTAEGSARLFTDGHFFTASGKAQLIPLQPKQPVQRPDSEHPFWLTTGRVRDQWHTMTRTARSARLLSHIEEPYLAIHPEDVLAQGLRAGQLVKIKNAYGECHLPLISDAGQQKGQLFSPIHWNDQFASKARIDTLVAPIVDPKSGQPEYKQVAVSIEPLACQWHAQLFTLDNNPELPAHDYWCHIPGQHVSRKILAGSDELTLKKLKALWEHRVDQWAEMADPGNLHFRLVGYKAGKPVLAFIAAKERKQIDSNWLDAIFADLGEESGSALAIAYGSPLSGGDTTPLICSCHRVRQSVIDSAIEGGAASAEEVGACTRAGTNCGSCIPEIKSLISNATGGAVKEQQS